MGGQMQQSNDVAAAMYNGGAPLYNAGPGGNANDAVMARWLQSVGLQPLASPMASINMLNLLMQGYGAQSAEEKQRLFKLMRNLNFNGESGSVRQYNRSKMSRLRWTPDLISTFASFTPSKD